MQNKGMVVAVRTAEITVRKKKDGAEFPGPIQKRGLYKSLDLDHGL
jgi:hypothetical protein